MNRPTDRYLRFRESVSGAFLVTAGADVVTPFLQPEEKMWGAPTEEAHSGSAQQRIPIPQANIHMWM